jgi:UDP-N-acetylmuramoylalanine--D-glutamate ligase
MKDRTEQFNTVIVGMGKTGYSCARFLAARNVSFAMTDSRKNPPLLEAIRKEFPHVPLYTGGFDAEMLAGAENLILSPGVSRFNPAIVAAAASGATVCGDIELFCRQATAPIVAITGSNGKSTVTTLVGEMARAAGLKAGVGGNLGTPALDLLAEGAVDVYVLELSSFQLETVASLNAAAAVVLNVSEDHMDRYRSMHDYTEAKARIYAGAGAMVINLDDPAVVNMQRRGRVARSFTLREPQGDEYGVRSYGDVRWLVRGREQLLPVTEIRMAGDHNAANALAALALGDILRLPREPMLHVLRTFPGLPHRCQWTGEINGVRWYNDSKGTNVGASCAAIKGLAMNKNLVLIAGGDGKGADFSSLAEIAAMYLRAAVLIGRDGPAIKKVLQNVVPVGDAKDMDDAVIKAAGFAERGDVVLLSPACASFDMFEDYRARGEAFKAAVNRLAGR